jgi:DNA-binding NtrC family response regulator
VKRVLLIDDDKDLGSTMQELLSLLGYEAHLSNSVESAKAALSNNVPWDAVISDYTLGDGTGIEILKHAVTLDGLRECSLAIASGYDKDALDVDFSGIEKAKWITKPFDIATLKSVIG